MYQHSNIRLSSLNYIGKAAYFITICCFDRQNVFSDSSLCAWLQNHLRDLSIARGFAVHAFCIMPDHLHLLVRGLNPHSSLLDFIRAFKIKTSRQFAQKHSIPLWQKKYFDHILRPDESLSAVAWYIWLNPIRAGLATLPGTYPFAGSFTNAIPTISPPETWLPPHEIQKRPPQKPPLESTLPNLYQNKRL